MPCTHNRLGLNSPAHDELVYHASGKTKMPIAEYRGARCNGPLSVAAPNATTTLAFGRVSQYLPDRVQSC